MLWCRDLSILGNLGRSLVIRDDMVGCLGLKGEGVLGYVSFQSLLSPGSSESTSTLTPLGTSEVWWREDLAPTAWASQGQREGSEPVASILRAVAPAGSFSNVLSDTPLHSHPTACTPHCKHTPLHAHPPQRQKIILSVPFSLQGFLTHF